MSSALFFPTPGDRGIEQTARRVCEGCEVSRQCHDYAQKSNGGQKEQFGIWAGVQYEKKTREPLKQAS